MADNPQNGNFEMWLPIIELKRGKELTGDGHPEQSEAKSRDPEEVPFKVTQRDPSVRAGLAGLLGMTDMGGLIFDFFKIPDQHSHLAQGGVPGAKISFSHAPGGGT